MMRNECFHSFAILVLAAAACLTMPLPPAQAGMIYSSSKVRCESTGEHSVTSEVARLWEDFALAEGKTTKSIVFAGGKTNIAGTVRGNITVYFGTLTLTPTAVVEGHIKVVGGTLKAAADAKVHGDVRVMGGRLEAEPGFKPDGKLEITDRADFGLAWFRTWTPKGLSNGILLPWSVGVSWILVAVALAFSILLSLLFPRSLKACAVRVREKPVQSLLLGLLVLAAIGPIGLLLVFSVIGILAIPFLIFAVLVAMVFGFIAVYRVVGQWLLQRGGRSQTERPVLALAIGTVIFTLAYMLPAIGLILFGLVTMLGFGAAWLAFFSRSKPAAPPAQSLPPAPASSVTAPPLVAQAAGAPNAPDSTPSVVPATVSTVEEMLPRAGFWMRVGAGLLDCILISLLISFCRPELGSVFLDPWPTTLLLVYLVGLWTWRGTTIGCIILRLKIVRTNGQPVTLGVSLVRALTSLLSLAVLGLGFFWIAWDKDKQAWHDKVAGTVVVRMPKGVLLI